MRWAVRIAAGLLAVFMIAYTLFFQQLFAADTYVSAMSVTFSLLVVFRAVQVFWSLPRPVPDAFLVHFMLFPIAFWFNPVDLVWAWANDMYCPYAECNNVTIRVQTFLKDIVFDRVSLILWVLFLFASLFVLTRVAAGKMWPGRQRE